jgi:hypothetical protein
MIVTLAVIGRTIDVFLFGVRTGVLTLTIGIVTL